MLQMLSGTTCINHSKSNTIQFEGLTLELSQVWMLQQVRMLDHDKVADKYLRCWLNDGNTVRVRRKA